MTTTETTALAPVRFKFSNSQIDPDWCAIRIREGWGYRYAWDFGDGTTSTEASPEHTYAAEGTYEAVLTVTDWLTSTTDTVTVVVSEAVDTDGDGLPDDADPDDDNDGVSDVDEALAGTDPLDAGSVFEVSGVGGHGGGSFGLMFDSVTGRLYEVLYKNSLMDTNGWLLMPTNWVGTGGPIEFQDNGDNAQRFYRLRVRLP